MELLLRSMEAPGGAAAETHRVDLPPTATLDDVKALLASKLSLARPVPAKWIGLFLNHREELVSPCPDAALPSLGLASGDFVFFAICPFRDLAFRARALHRNPSPGSGALQRQSLMRQSIEGRVRSCLLRQVPFLFSPHSSKSWSSFVLGDLKREMANVGSAKGTAAGRLVAALHAALLDVGFVTANQMGSRFSLPQGWPSGALEPLTIKYTIPELSALLPVTEKGKVVVLRYSLMANFVMVHGYVHGAQSELCELCLELPGLEPLLHLDSDQLSGVHEKGIHDLWRVLKDEICLPLMISLCQLNGLRLPPCLMALPADLKTKVLELLPGVELAKVECTCKEMRNLASDDSIWEYFFSKQGNYGKACRGDSKSAKAAFARYWQAQKRLEQMKFEQMTLDDPIFW